MFFLDLRQLAQDRHIESIAHSLCSIGRMANVMSDISGSVLKKRQGCCFGYWCCCTPKSGLDKAFCLFAQ